MRVNRTSGISQIFLAITIAGIVYSGVAIYLWGDFSLGAKSKVADEVALSEPATAEQDIDRRAGLVVPQSEPLPPEAQRGVAPNRRDADLDAKKGQDRIRERSLSQELVVRASRYVNLEKYDKETHPKLVSELASHLESADLSAEERAITVSLLRSVNDLGISELRIEIDKLKQKEREKRIIEFLVETPGLSASQREGVRKLVNSGR